MIKGAKQGEQKKIVQLISKWLLKLIGWQAVGKVPDTPKYVLLGYPHTSNWDVPIGILVYKALGVRLQWVGKHTLFKKPQVWIIKPLGGIPVNRDQTKNFVQAVVDVFNKSDKLVLAVSPEATRSKSEYWKSGFYYIAHGAGVPIATGFLDYTNKKGGFGPLIKPSGDIHADMKLIKEFYSGIEGKFPQLMGEIKLKP